MLYNRVLENTMSLLNKRGQMGGAKGGVDKALGAVILVVIATALAPTMFENADNITGAPTWVTTVLVVIIGAGLVTLIWKRFN